MTSRPLLPRQPITADGNLASAEMLEIIQRLVTQANALEARMAKIAAVLAPTGGATIDAQSRTAIAAIIAAAT